MQDRRTPFFAFTALMVATTLPTIAWDRFDSVKSPVVTETQQAAAASEEGALTSAFGPFTRLLNPEPVTRPLAKVAPQPPVIPAGTAFEKRFIEEAIGPAQESQRATGVPASVTIAQAILESDWGESQLATKGKNYFGIKTHDKDGSAGSITFPTWEVGGGENVTVLAAFRAYNSMVDSFVDHGMFFIENRRYRKALQHTRDAREFARQIAVAGYATDPAYADKLIRLMDKFSLLTFDSR